MVGIDETPIEAYEAGLYLKGELFLLTQLVFGGELYMISNRASSVVQARISVSCGTDWCRYYGLPMFCTAVSVCMNPACMSLGTVVLCVSSRCSA